MTRLELIAVAAPLLLAAVGCRDRAPDRATQDTSAVAEPGTRPRVSGAASPAAQPAPETSARGAEALGDRVPVSTVADAGTPAGRDAAPH